MSNQHNHIVGYITVLVCTQYAALPVNEVMSSFETGVRSLMKP